MMSGQRKYIAKGGLAVSLLFVFLMFFACSEPEPFPKEMIGRWITDAPLYGDRYIEINETELIIGTGEIEPNIFFIKSFKSKPQDKGILWVFNCELRRGELFDISLVYYPDKAYEKLQMKNSPKVWWYLEDE